jgi:hypothetical protein
MSLQYALAYEPMTQGVDAQTTAYSPAGYQSYATQALDLSGEWIRLLRFHEGGFWLENVDLGTHPSYTALSYSWGPPEPTRKIKLHGRSFRVRENLADFLQKAYRPHEDGYIWIDAICIDQKNVEEKNHQLPLMSHIFYQASKVIVWLGLGDRRLESALKSAANADMRRAKELCRSREDQRQLVKLFQRNNYWTRVWIIQEIMFSHDIFVRCGSREVSWVGLSTFFYNIQEGMRS